MEVNDLNNKLDKQSKEMLKKLGGGIEDLSNLAGGALKSLDRSMRDGMTEKEYIKYKAFKVKYLNLKAAENHKAAQDLADYYGK